MAQPAAVRPRPRMESPRSLRRWALLAALLAAPAFGQQAPSASQPPPAVVVAAVQTQSVERSARFIGNIEAIQSVDLKARVEGFLEAVDFDQGSMVTQGKVLYRIEQDQYKADLDQARGQLAAAEAEADAAAANLEDKEADYQRQATLIKKGDTSQTAFDQAKAARDEGRANVEKAKASRQQAQAQVDTAQINLGYTSIASPIAGRIGATAVTAGNLVNTNSGTLATVAQLDPIRAVFSVSSSDLVRLQKRVGSAASEQARREYVPELILPDGTDYDHPGKIRFADNQVDPATGTVAVYADFPNPQHLLLPGQFVSVVVHQAEQQRLPVVPAAAVMRTRDGVQVYLVDADNRVQLRKVELGPRVDDGYAVHDGLADGELVIVSGIQKVQPGMTVAPSGASAMQTGVDSDSDSDSDTDTDSDSDTDTDSDSAADADKGAAGSAAASDASGG